MRFLKTWKNIKTITRNIHLIHKGLSNVTDYPIVARPAGEMYGLAIRSSYFERYTFY